MLCDNVELRRSFALRSSQLVDGHGARRIAVALTAPLLELRRATMADAQLLFKGRNAEEVRRYAFNTEPVGWSDHLAWLERAVQDQNRLLLIAKTAAGPIGVVRYDLHLPEHSVEVSIYLFEGQGGAGWGQALLRTGEQYLRRHWPQVTHIQARIKPDNAASRALFAKAGYVQGPLHFQRELNDE